MLTFNYNATVTALFGSTSSERILQHAHTLVAELVADRQVSDGWVPQPFSVRSAEINKLRFFSRAQLEDATERPIIFICHSLGGIVVKRVRHVVNNNNTPICRSKGTLTDECTQALAYSASRTSKLVQHLHSIFVSTYAVLFLGTPHNGSSKASLASTGRRLIDALVPSKVWDTSGQLLDALQEGSETLQNITDMFVPLMKNFRVHFFWEQVKTDFGVGLDYVRSYTAGPRFLLSVWGSDIG